VEAGGATSGPRQYIDRLIADAARTQRPIVLDSAPLIDFLARHLSVGNLVRPILLNLEVPKMISTVTLSEVTTGAATINDHARLNAVWNFFTELPNMSIIDFDQRHAVEAAYVRAASGLKLPDAAIVATARLAGATALIGNDRQWRNKPLGVAYHHMDDILALG
jgi:PIN domain nuclease of toxin-antitoxin system